MLIFVAIVMLLTMLYVPLSLGLPFQKQGGLELYKSLSAKCFWSCYPYSLLQKIFV